MKIFIAIFFCLLLPFSVIAAEKENGYTVKYSGGSITEIKHGAYLRLFMNADQVRIERTKKPVGVIPIKSILEISYGLDTRHRIQEGAALAVFTMGIGGVLALTKSKNHYVGIIWDDQNGNKGGLVLEVGKNSYRGVLAGLEGLTGKRSVDADAEAAKEKGKPKP
jgi:hypothetical protein